MGEKGTVSGGNRIPDAVLRRIVESACLAPSIHNTQPWAWRAGGGTLDLYADTARRLAHADPDGRNLVISCGAALQHVQVAAAGLGWDAAVERFPDGGLGYGTDGTTSDATARGDLRRLALIRFRRRKKPAKAAARDLRLLAERCTDRRRFTSWPVPPDLLQDLAARAVEWGASATPVTGVAELFTAGILVGRAYDREAADPFLSGEQRRWVDHSDADGVPSAVLPQHDHVRRPSGTRIRFEDGHPLPDTGREIEPGDGLILLWSEHDDAAAWLRVGEGLSALWLEATRQRLAVVPLSQVIEVPETRADLRYQVLGGAGLPQLLIRVGWQAISRSQLPRTPRRPLADVLLE